jgi:hypothetical protein
MINKITAGRIKEFCALTKNRLYANKKAEGDLVGNKVLSTALTIIIFLVAAGAVIFLIYKLMS